MSVDSFVFLRDDRLPSMGEWQRALDQEDTGIVLDGVDDLRAHTGFLPARFKGHASGFEWFYGPAGDAFAATSSDLGQRSFAAHFVTHSDMRELICAMIAGAVLAKLADGLVFEEESGEYITGAKALDVARQSEVDYL